MHKHHSLVTKLAVKFANISHKDNKDMQTP